MNEIDVATLQNWLAQKRDVAVLDVRNDEDREQWSIPGSSHVNAYDELKAGRPGPLADLRLPTGIPVVTVCNLGRMAAVAAEKLEGRGSEVFVLRGGMKSWSLAWNTAEITLGNATVVQVRRTGKGCLSYIITSQSEVIVLDASLDPAVYLGLAKQRSWVIRYVLDTHVHADHLSRSRALAEVAGAVLLLPAQNRVRFPFTPIADGQTVEFGGSRIRAISAPGHTMESTCYNLDGRALFTGDTLFISGVGRPDLHASPDEAQERARVLYRSLRRLLELPADTLVLPGHASQPSAFDQKAICEQLGPISTRIASWLRSEEEFVGAILDRIPPTPPNYVRIVELNEAGQMPDGDPTDLEAGANRCAVS